MDELQQQQHLHLHHTNRKLYHQESAFSKHKQKLKAAAAYHWQPHHAKMATCRPQSQSQETAAAEDEQDQQQQQEHLIDSIQRKLFTCLYVYAILIVSLYLTYAAYYFFQQHQQLAKTSGRFRAANSAAAAAAQSQELRAEFGQLNSNANAIADSSANMADTNAISAKEEQQQEKLESKLHLLERYIELIAIDLQETKQKLKEREKCDCSIGCTFNGTRYEDKSSWQNQCDICVCQAGKISCQPKKCPPIKCDDSVILPGQCCPTCMRKCKHNNQLIRHGQKFNPIKTSTTDQMGGVGMSNSNNNNNNSNNQVAASLKTCQCLDGRIKCESIASSGSGGKVKPPAGSNSPAGSANKSQRLQQPPPSQQPPRIGRPTEEEAQSKAAAVAANLSSSGRIAPPPPAANSLKGNQITADSEQPAAANSTSQSIGGGGGGGAIN